MPQLSHPKGQFVEDRAGAAPDAPSKASDVLALLDELLAAERAGVKAATALRDEHPPGPIRTLLDVVRIDEAESCKLLAQAVRLLGGDPGSRVGDFAQKILAVDGELERLAFLQRGQRWVVRRLEEAIPRVSQPEVAAALRKVLEIHDANVAACDAVLAAAPGAAATPPAKPAR